MVLSPMTKSSLVATSKFPAQRPDQRVAIILVILVLKGRGSPRHSGKRIKIFKMRGGRGQRLAVHHEMSDRHNFAGNCAAPVTS